jgi:Secretion system C-terminal sorting domain
MKNFLPFLVAIILSIGAKAQITITQSDMPIAGDSSTRVTANNTTGLDFVSTGANQVWDFSALTYTTSTTTNYTAITGAPIFALFTFGPFATNANLRSQIFLSGNSPLNFGTGPTSGLFSVSNTLEFYKKNASRYAKTGYSVNLNGIDVPLAFDSNDVIYALPMNFNNVDSCLSIFEINTQFLSFLYYRTRQKRVNHVDGWGKLKLPNGFDYDVLRVKAELYAVDTFHVDTTIFGVPLSVGLNLPRPKSIEYKWLAKGLQEPVMIATGTEIAGNFTPTSVRYLNKVALANNDVDFTNTNKMYPTIVSQFLQLDFMQPLNSISVLDINGKIVQQLDAKNRVVAPSKLDCSGLQSGVYIVSALFANGKSINQQIIKQ